MLSRGRCSVCVALLADIGSLYDLAEPDVMYSKAKQVIDDKSALAQTHGRAFIFYI